MQKSNLPFKILGGIFFQSWVALLFQVSLSRLLPIQLWHHFAFLIISCALLGYGTAGSYLLLFTRPSHPFIPSLLFVGTLLPLFAGANHLPFDPALLPLENTQWLFLCLFYLLLALPFFFCGLTLNLLLQRYSQQSFQLYCADLLGAACGVLCFFVIAPYQNEMEWLAVTSLLGCIACWFLATQRWQQWSTLGVALVLVGSWSTGSLPEFRISLYKALPQALQYPNSHLLNTSWNAASRIDWLESPLARFAPGLSLNFQGTLPPQTGMTQDGDQLTGFTPKNPITRQKSFSPDFPLFFKGGQGDFKKKFLEYDNDVGDYLTYLPSWFLYQLPESPKNALILQTLGGQEILPALKANVPQITVQSENQIIAQWLKNQYAFPHIDYHAEKARTFLAQHAQQYDRLIVSLETALPTGNTGMVALQESPLETVEGMEALLTHLGPKGWLSLHRYLLPPPRAELRLVATLMTAMQNLGWQPEQQMGIFRTVSTMMILVSRQTWSTVDKESFQKFCEERSYTPVYYPGMPLHEANQTNRFAQPIYADPIHQLLRDPQSLYQSNIFDLRPTTDDRPFFYHFLRWHYVPEIYESLDRKWEGLVEAGLLLPVLLLQTMLVALVFIIGPFVLQGKIRSLFSLKMFYFFAIGLGFMGVEIGLFEKLILFLGDPVYSFGLVLSGLLIASGVGSGMSKYLSPSLLSWASWGLLALLILYYFSFSQVLSWLAGTPFTIRLMVAFFGVSLLGILMGMPFPRGLVLLSFAQTEAQPIQDKVAFAWCLNGFASVIGSVGAMLLAQITGLASLFLWSGLCYGVAFWLLRKF